jgi:hypothetical protein
MYDLSDSEDARDRDIEERSNGGSKEKQGEAPAAVAAVAAASGCAAAGGCAAVDWAVSCATDDAGKVQRVFSRHKGHGCDAVGMCECIVVMETAAETRCSRCRGAG